MDTSCKVLSPDHHLLDKFQKLLKEYLLNQIARMKEEVLEIEAETENKKKQTEQLGVQTYEYQQRVQLRQKELETLTQNVETTVAAHEKEQLDLEENKKQLKNVENKLFQTEKNNRDLLREIESITQLNKQLEDTEKKIDDHISVNKRKVEKTKLDKKMLIQKKNRQDYMLHLLTEAVWKQESELETLHLQQNICEQQLQDLEEKVVVGNTAIAALQVEYKGLMTAWQSVVLAIGKRDKSLEFLHRDYTKLQEKYKSMMMEVEQIRKLVKKEMRANESFSRIKKKLLDEIKNAKTDRDVQLEKKINLENEMFNLQSILGQTDQDLKLLQDEMQQKQLANDNVIKNYNNVYERKTSLEEEIMKYVQSEITTNRFGKRVKNDLMQMKAKRQEVEVLAHLLGNKHNTIKAEVERLDMKNEELMLIKEDIQQQCQSLENESKKLKADMEALEFTFRKKEQHLVSLNSKLEYIKVKKFGELFTNSELKVRELEKIIEEAQCSVKQLQIVWLREQTSILNVSAVRQDQIENINVVKKQLLLLEQKNIRINDEIEELKKQEAKVNHNICMLHNKTILLCDAIFKKKNRRNDLNQNNALVQSKYQLKLQDSEMQLLQIMAEITNLEEEKPAMCKQLMELNREILEWEKNFKLIKDTVNNVKGGTGGEVSSMRLEIHKMEVILGQLKKAQDKLLKDLEHCLYRRERLFLTSEANQKPKNSISKIPDSGKKIRMHFTKKLDNLKNQIKQTKSDISVIKKKLEPLEVKIQEKQSMIELIQRQKLSMDTVKSSCKSELEDVKLNREFKFELLVLNQRKAMMYKQIIKNQKPYVVYKQHELASEYRLARTMNDKLTKIIDKLEKDFPDKKKLFFKLRNLLGLVSLCMQV